MVRSGLEDRIPRSHQGEMGRSLASRGEPSKVFYFTDNPGFGGTEKMLLTIMTGIDPSRWRPILVHRQAPGFEKLDECAQKLEIKIWDVAEMKGRRDAAWAVPVSRRFRTERPAVFHAHRATPNQGAYGLLAAILARVPAVVVTQHYLNMQKEPLRRRLQEMAFSAGVDRFIAVSHDVARNLRRRCIFPSRIRVVHNGIDLRPFGRPPNRELRAFLKKNTDRRIVLCIARLDRKQKGLRFLVQAAPLVPEAQFILAGEGPERPELEAQARALGVQDRVTLLGFFDDPPELLASCDLFVLPSLCEGFGLSVAEAMAAGKPVVASNIGGVNEVVVDQETGLLVRPADPVLLAEAIRRVLGDPVLAQRMGTAGKVRVHREFSAEKMIRRTTDVYEEILGRGGRHFPAAADPDLERVKRVG